MLPMSALDVEDLTEEELIKLNKDYTLVVHSSGDLIGPREVDLMAYLCLFRCGRLNRRRADQVEQGLHPGGP